MTTGYRITRMSISGRLHTSKPEHNNSILMHSIQYADMLRVRIMHESFNPRQSRVGLIIQNMGCFFRQS